MIALEHAVEKTCIELITREFGSDDIPVLQSDESMKTDDPESVFVTAKRQEDPMLIDEANRRLSTWIYEVAVTLRTFAVDEDLEPQSERWEMIERAMRSTDGTGINLDRFLDFVVLPSGGSEGETGGEGNRERTRTFKIAIVEAIG